MQHHDFHDPRWQGVLIMIHLLLINRIQQFGKSPHKISQVSQLVLRTNSDFCDKRSFHLTY